jgi:hypothetical protein
VRTFSAFSLDLTNPVTLWPFLINSAAIEPPIYPDAPVKKNSC